MPKGKRGLYGKYFVLKVADLSESHREAIDAIAGEYKDMECFVLRYDRDVHALEALLAYAASCEQENPTLAADLLKLVAIHGD